MEDVLGQTEDVLHVFGFQGRLQHIPEFGDVDRGKGIAVGHINVYPWQLFHFNRC